MIGTDIDSGLDWFCEHVLRSKTPDNYEFKQDNIYNPKVNVMLTAVVFFGACGSLSDAIMDFAIRLNSLYLICRTCCHENPFRAIDMISKSETSLVLSLTYLSR